MRKNIIDYSAYLGRAREGRPVKRMEKRVTMTGWILGRSHSHPPAIHVQYIYSTKKTHKIYNAP